MRLLLLKLTCCCNQLHEDLVNKVAISWPHNTWILFTVSQQKVESCQKIYFWFSSGQFYQKVGIYKSNPYSLVLQIRICIKPHKNQDNLKETLLIMAQNIIKKLGCKIFCQLCYSISKQKAPFCNSLNNYLYYYKIVVLNLFIDFFFQLRVKM